MSTIQRQLDQFDKQIMLGRFEENAILREKRDIIRNKLKERLPGVFEQHEEACPEYYWRDQGSYEMGTGIIPLEGDYDIDQGLYFMVSTDSYPDPVVLKKRVYEALDGHTSRVEVRRPCVIFTSAKKNLFTMSILRSTQMVLKIPTANPGSRKAKSIQPRNIVSGNYQTHKL